MSARAADHDTESRLGHTSGVVLCTGVHDLRAGDGTLAERAVQLLAEICENVIVAGAEAPPGTSGRGASTPPLGTSGRGASTPPLGRSEAGLLTAALADVATDYVLVLSADHPALTPDLLIGLVGLPDAPAAMPRDALGAHPTCARYACADIAAGLAKTAGGAGDLSKLAFGLDVRWLEGESLAALDPDGSALERVRNEAELEAWLARDAVEPEGAWPGHPGLGWSRARP